MLAAAPYGPAMQGLVSQIATDPGLARVYREQVVRPRLAQLAPVIARGIARGDLRPGTEVRSVHELLAGPIFYRLLLSGAPLDRTLGARLVDALLAGFTAALVAGQQRPKLRRGPVGKLSAADHQLATSTSGRISGPAGATKHHRGNTP
jgi:hypothetical protein